MKFWENLLTIFQCILGRTPIPIHVRILRKNTLGIPWRNQYELFEINLILLEGNKNIVL